MSAKASKKAQKKAPAKAAKTATTAASRLETPELAALRAHARRKKDDAFFTDPAFGEVRLLAAGERPDMASDPGLPWHAADWFAEEADGAALGYLRLPGLAPEDAPVAMIDNEGSFSVTGLSIIDHFALATEAGWDGGPSIQPLIDFCRAAKLPGPRTADVVKTIVQKARLHDIDHGVPKVDAAALREAVRASRPQVPPRPAKPRAAPRKKDGPLRPESEFAYGCVGPDGRAWLAAYANGKKMRILRFTGERLEVVATAPCHVMEMASLGDALFTAAAFQDEGAILRDGVWTRFAVPERGDGWLFGDGAHALYFVGRSGAVHRWDGSALVHVKKAPAREGAILGIDPAGALYLVCGARKDKYLGEVHRVEGDRVTELPRCPNEYSMGGCVARGAVVAYGSGGEVYILPHGAGAWKGPITVAGADRMVALPSGAVVVLEKKHRVRVLDPATRKVADRGALLLKSWSLTDAYVPTHDGRLLLAGGTLGTRSRHDAPMVPQLWDEKTGKTIALPGFEEEMAAQVKEQATKYRFPW